MLASNLKPLDKGEKLFENEHFQQPWNIHAGKRESATQEQGSSDTLKVKMNYNISSDGNQVDFF